LDKKNIILPIEYLRKVLTNDVLIIKKLGKALFEELDKSEKTVSKTWETYRGIEEEMIQLRCQSQSNQYIIPLKMETHHDAWIVEMYYRMSVT